MAMIAVTMTVSSPVVRISRMVNLESIDWELPQIAQARVAGAEGVDSDLHSSLA